MIEQTTEELEQAIAFAARWCEVRTDEPHGGVGKNFGMLSRALLNTRELFARRAEEVPSPANLSSVAVPQPAHGESGPSAPR